MRNQELFQPIPKISKAFRQFESLETWRRWVSWKFCRKVYFSLLEAYVAGGKLSKRYLVSTRSIQNISRSPGDTRVRECLHNGIHWSNHIKSLLRLKFLYIFGIELTTLCTAIDWFDSWVESTELFDSDKWLEGPWKDNELTWEFDSSRFLNDKSLGFALTVAGIGASETVDNLHHYGSHGSRSRHFGW